MQKGEISMKFAYTNEYLQPTIAAMNTIVIVVSRRAC